MRRMGEKSLKVYDTEKTFFSKITNTLNNRQNGVKWYANFYKKK